MKEPRLGCGISKAFDKYFTNFIRENLFKNAKTFFEFSGFLRINKGTQKF